MKGRELRINKVNVLDVDQTSGMVRGTSVVNLFSPQNRDYGVSFVPLPMDQAPPEKPSKSTGAEVLTSWMGTPENQFGGMGNSGRMGFSSGGYSAEPVGSSERLEGVRVAIWSTKSLTSRWYGPSPNLVEADLLPSGIDRLTGTVVNRLPIPLEDAILVFGRQVYQIGDMAPNVVIRVELTKDRYLSGLLGESAKHYINDQNQAPQQEKLDRADLLIGIMFHDSRDPGSEVPKENAVFRSLDLSGQLALGRPMLVGKLKRPAAALVLDNAGVEPKTEQTTIVRMILPLAKKPTPKP